MLVSLGLVALLEGKKKKLWLRARRCCGPSDRYNPTVQFPAINNINMVAMRISDARLILTLFNVIC
jgi:hypothetical protein